MEAQRGQGTQGSTVSESELRPRCLNSPIITASTAAISKESQEAEMWQQ